jgi:hypothetical protein
MSGPAPYAIIGSDTMGDGPLERLDAKARHTLFTGARTANTFADTPVSDAELFHPRCPRPRPGRRADERLRRGGVDAEFFPDGRLHSILVVNIGHAGENPWFGRLPGLDHDDVVQWA